MHHMQSMDPKASVVEFTDPLPECPPAQWRSYYTLLSSFSFARCDNSSPIAALDGYIREILETHGSMLTFEARAFASLSQAIAAAHATDPEPVSYARKSVICLLPSNLEHFRFSLQSELRDPFVVNSPLCVLGPVGLQQTSLAELCSHFRVHFPSSSGGVFLLDSMRICNSSGEPAAEQVLTVEGENSVARLSRCEITKGDKDSRMEASAGGTITAVQCAASSLFELKQGGELHAFRSRFELSTFNVQQGASLTLQDCSFSTETGSALFSVHPYMERLHMDGCISSNMMQDDVLRGTRDSFYHHTMEALVSLPMAAANGTSGRVPVFTEALCTRVASCIYTLSNLCKLATTYETWSAREQLVTHVAAAMKAAPDHIEIQTAGCSLFWGYSSSNIMKRRFNIMAMGEAVMKAVTRFGARSATLAQAGVATLANLCTSPPAKINLKPLREMLDTDDFVSAVLNILRTLRKYQNIPEACLFLLWGFSSEARAGPRDRVFALGGLDLFLELLATESEMPELRGTICGALSNIIITSTQSVSSRSVFSPLSTGSNRALFVARGGLKVMAALLEDEDEGESALKVKTEVCVFLRAFCYANDAIPADDFRSLGVLKSLIRLSDSQYIEGTLRENAIACLANFASCSEENKIVLRDGGGIRPLLAALRQLDPDDEGGANRKMAAIIAVSHLSSQGSPLESYYQEPVLMFAFRVAVQLSSGDLKEIELYWENNRDLLDVIFSPNDVKFVMHTSEPAIKMMALWCMAHIALEEPPVGNELTWKLVYEKLEPFITELRSKGTALPVRHREILRMALEKLAPFGVAIAVQQ